MALTPFFSRSHGYGGFMDAFPSIVDSMMFDPWDFSVTGGPRSGRGDGGQMIGYRAKVDWTETPEAHVFKADMPGLKKEDIKVEVLDGKTLSISGERNVETRNETDSWRCVERSFGKFRRQFGLPEHSKVEEVSAKVEDGVLTVTVPKSKDDAPKVHTIDVA